MNPRRLLIASAIVAVVLAGTACGNDEVETGGPAVVTDNTVPVDEAGEVPAPGDAEPTGSPGETLAMVIAVDDHEVAMAEQAREKGVTGDVLAYADRLHADHSANAAASRQLSTTISLSPLDTDAVLAYKAKGEAEMERLAQLDGEAYADAYVDAMVTGHTEALEMLEARLEGITDQAFGEHLSSTRDTIERHLEMGKALQAGEPMDMSVDAGADADDDTDTEASDDTGTDG